MHHRSPVRFQKWPWFPKVIFWVSLITLQILLIGTAFFGGFLFYAIRYDNQNISLDTTQDFPLLSEAYHLLQQNAFLNLPDQTKMEYGMIRGMLQVYNEPFTVFIEPPQNELQTQQLQGKYGGIGVRIERDSQKNIFLFPQNDSPATQAGLKDGDRLYKISDTQVTSEMTDDEIQALLRGPVGHSVLITIGHSPEYTPIPLKIPLTEISIPSTTWNLLPDFPQTGIVYIKVIAETTPAEVTQAIHDLQSQGATQILLDVRNNGGGLVESGVDLARLFLKDGVVIDEQYRGEPVKTYSVDRPGPFVDLPVAVLVNHGTASAAEIFAGALQGQNRALLIGSTTYGKNSIQLVFTLKDGSSLHVTAAHWWIPSLNQDIHSKGLQPDLPVTDEEMDAKGIQVAVQSLSQK